MRTSLVMVLLGLGAGCATQDRSVAPAREFLAHEARRLEEAWHREAGEHRNRLEAGGVTTTLLLGAAVQPSTLTFEPLHDSADPDGLPAPTTVPGAGPWGAEVADSNANPSDSTPSLHSPADPAIAHPAEPESRGSGAPDASTSLGEFTSAEDVGAADLPAVLPARSWPPPWSAQREGGRPYALRGHRVHKRLALPPCPTLPNAAAADDDPGLETVVPPADEPPLADGSGPLQVHLFGGAKEVNGAFTWGPCTPFRDDLHPTSHSDYEFAERPIASIIGLRLSF